MLATLEGIRAAAARIEGIARRTPVLDLAPLLPLHVKCEQMQPIGAFKIRGAYNYLARLTESQRSRGVVTYSSGNHGQAVAFAAQRFGVPAVIVMPETAPAVKVDGARRWGAEVQFAGTTTVHRQARAEVLADERGLLIVPPFDCLPIIEGQGTAGLELVAQVPGVRTVVVPVGGGGLISGVAAAVKLSDPSIRVVGVEPEGAPKMSRSLAAGMPVTLPSVKSIADGLMAVRPGALNFLHVQAFVDEVDHRLRRSRSWTPRGCCGTAPGSPSSRAARRRSLARSRAWPTGPAKAQWWRSSAAATSVSPRSRP